MPGTQSPRGRGSFEGDDREVGHMISSGRRGSSGSPNASSTYARSFSEALSLFSWGRFPRYFLEPASGTYLFIVRCRRKMSSLIKRIFEGPGRLNVPIEPTGTGLSPGFPVDVQAYLGILRRNTSRTERFIEL